MSHEYSPSRAGAKARRSNTDLVRGHEWPLFPRFTRRDGPRRGRRPRITVRC
jgi:hypothetical protein